MACAIALGQNITSKWLHLVEPHHPRLKKTIDAEQRFDTVGDTS